MDIKAEIRQYVEESFLSGGEGAGLDNATPLISGGLIDSIGMIGLVRFLEGHFGIEFTPREVDAYSLDTIDAMERLVEKKMTAVRANPPRS